MVKTEMISGHNNKSEISRGLLWTIYTYVSLPVIIFSLGWCKWYIGIPVAAIVLFGIFLSIREHGGKKENSNSWLYQDRKKVILICVLIAMWLILSGVGNYSWQNYDHVIRNAIYESMVMNKWPIMTAVDINGEIQCRTLTYYIGYWMPAALVGKLLGVQAGYAMQFIWAFIGIFIFYAMLCVRQKKVLVWPLLVFIFFSGLDAVGIIFSHIDKLEIFGSNHLEAWSGPFQYSSVTTQLFWVFNQAIPAWVVCNFIFLYEKPKNMVFLLALLPLSSSFPSVGLIPFVIYFMIKRGKWADKYTHFSQLINAIVKNWFSIQNIFCGGVIGILVSIYLLGCKALIKSFSSVFGGRSQSEKIGILIIVIAIILIVSFMICVLTLKGAGKYLRYIVLLVGIVAIGCRLSSWAGTNWQSSMYWWFNLTVFYFLEAGVFLVIMGAMIEDKSLLKLTGITLYIIPLITVGNSCDFCMRASIPGLLLIFLWCIQCIYENKDRIRVGILIIVVLIGAITPIHEIKRSYVNTMNPYENAVESSLYMGNNFTGSPDSFFFKYIAKNRNE